MDTNLIKHLDDFSVSPSKNCTTTMSNISTVGPLVPPKPKKPQPQIPHSYLLKPKVAPSYSSNLHQTSNGPMYTNVPPDLVYLSGKGNTTPSPYVNLSGVNHDIESLQQPQHAPPSPVSSSYSELRRATEPNHLQYGGNEVDSIYGYGQYESIYEPINPRPSSQLSTRSHCSLYTPYVSGNSSSVTTDGKEQEVDSLTDLLVHNMNTDTDWDLYGVCVKCNQKIIGEHTGCTAMDKLYHIKCFTCFLCGINLQGKPFYPLDNKPYCESDYMNTLEKCCVCSKPILDRILRATGKPYHPKCFSCVVCGKSLDGIPFTVDATNRVHCIEDFHKIFAPRCWVCKLPIMPEPNEDETVRVVALDHSFHIQCYKCEDCDLLLSSEADGRGCYPLDGHVLCKSCNAKRVQLLTGNMIVTEL